jgi:hypothetical protein
MTTFVPYGPYLITRKSKTLISRDKADVSEFWKSVEADRRGLSEACGCYVFVIRGRAWYVGRAERQSFKHECFSLHKILQYNDALHSVAGPPSLILLAKTTPGRRFAKPARHHGDVCFLESLLIGSALRRNQRLQNIKGTRLLREMRVPGVLNTGQGQGRSAIVQQLRKALGA